MDSRKEDLSQLLSLIYSGTFDSIKELLSTSTHLVNCIDLTTGNFPLIAAVETENVELVELLLELRTNTNFKIESTQEELNGRTALMSAAQVSNAQICEMLLESDADVDAADHFNRTPIVHAIKSHASKRVVELLLFWGAHIDDMDDDGNSLLCLAAKNSNHPFSAEVIRLLLAVGCDELSRDNRGQTALHLAAKCGNRDVISAFYEIGSENLNNARDNFGRTPLHEASGNNHLDACRLLVNSINVNASSHDGRTPFSLAALNGHIQVMKLLVDHGADIDHTDADGKSTVYALVTSCDSNGRISENKLSSLRYLTTLGVDLEARNAEAQTCLHVATLLGGTSIVQSLVEGGSQVNALDREGQTPLHLAALKGHTEIMKILINAGADLNFASTEQDATPLLIATEQGNLKAVQRLIESGADPYCADVYGRSPLEVALRCGHDEIATLLESRALQDLNQLESVKRINQVNGQRLGFRSSKQSSTETNGHGSESTTLSSETSTSGTLSSNLKNDSSASGRAIPPPHARSSCRNSILDAVPKHLQLEHLQQFDPETTVTNRNPRHGSSPPHHDQSSNIVTTDVFLNLFGTATQMPLPDEKLKNMTGWRKGTKQKKKLGTLEKIVKFLR